MRTFAGRILGILALLALLPACGVGGSGASTLTPTVAPGAPAQVKAVAGNKRVTLSWVGTGSGEIFTVLRSLTPGGPYFPISVPSGFVTPTRYVDRGLSNGTTYYYVVTSSNSFGQSAASAEASGTPGFKPVDIESGSASDHTLALFEDGSVWGWGSNSAGQMATGDFGTANSPIEITALEGVIGLAAGTSHSLFLLNDGSVWGVGATFDGQLGPGLPTFPPVLTPVKIPGLSNIVAISAGSSHNLALANDGTVWAWGNNVSGQVGTGVAGGTVPTPFPIPLPSAVASIAAGYYFSLVIDVNGTIWAWGENSYGQLGLGGTSNNNPVPTQVPNLNGVTQVSGGAYHAMALRNDGSVWGWGNNNQGQVGIGSFSTPQPNPVPTSTLTSGVAGIAAGQYSSMAVRDDGSVWVWGSTAGGGNAPAKFGGLSGIQKITAGSFHNVALRDDGALFTWGDNTFGQLGIGTSSQSLTPLVVNNLTSAILIAGGSQHSQAARSGGSFWTWGGNQFGTLCNGTSSPTVTTNLPAQVQPLTFTNVTATAAGRDHGVAVDTGIVYTWGSNAAGQIGNNTTSTTPVTAPFKVTSLTGTMTDVSGGMNFTLALRSGGDVFAWGQNSFGQIGTGASSSSVNLPTKVTVLDKATAIAAGGAHALALRTDLPLVSGALWAWGANTNGQLGNGSSGPAPLATPFPTGLVNMTAIAAGSNHSLAIRNDLANDGTVWAWGWNAYGQVGNGDPSGANVTTAFQVPGLSGAIAVAAGDSHSLALLGDGSVWAWGQNDSGQLGDGTNVLRRSPIRVPGLSGITRIACGSTHNLAISSSGLLWAWGNNAQEQLGSPNIKSSMVPVLVSP